MPHPRHGSHAPEGTGDHSPVPAPFVPTGREHTPDLSPHTRCVVKRDQKDAILVLGKDRLAKHRSRKPSHKFVKPPSSSSEEDDSESSLSDMEYQDHLVKTKEEAIRDYDWGLANKITAFPTRTQTSTLCRVEPYALPQTQRTT